MNVEVLSRIQFAFTISFHFLFPPMTIGLGAVLVIMQTLRAWTGNLDMARFWTKVFPLAAAMTSYGLNHLSEIADRDTPHTPRGCPFQAWSLGEFLRLKHQILQSPT